MATADMALRDLFAYGGDPVGKGYKAFTTTTDCKLESAVLVGVLLLHGHCTTAHASASPSASEPPAGDTEADRFWRGVHESVPTPAPACRGCQLVGACRTLASSASSLGHVSALHCWLLGDMIGAARAWRTALAATPLDAFALRFIHDAYFFVGDFAGMLETLLYVLPYWNADRAARGASLFALDVMVSAMSVPSDDFPRGASETMDAVYGFLIGQLAFAWEENGRLDDAERAAQFALSINATDAWAIHAQTHVHEVNAEG
jgi:hypothetical protein